MIFGPRACNVTLAGVALPVVSEYKYLGMVLFPTLSRGSSRPARGELHNACLGAVLNASRCTWRHPSSLCPSCPVLLGSRNSSQHHPLPSRVWIGRCASGVGSCQVGPLASIGVLVEFGWPKTQKGSLGVAFCHYLAVSPPFVPDARSMGHLRAQHVSLFGRIKRGQPCTSGSE